MSHFMKMSRSLRHKKNIFRKLDRIWGNYCIICGRNIELSATGKGAKTIDHIIPISKGGTGVLDNLAWAHAKCNFHKNDGSLIAAMKWAEKAYANVSQ